MRARKVDSTQRDIVDALRKMGASVWLAHTVGGGFPDLIVGLNGRNYLIEVKTPKGAINDLQRQWMAAWRGQVTVVRSVDDAIAFMRRLGDNP